MKEWLAKPLDRLARLGVPLLLLAFGPSSPADAGFVSNNLDARELIGVPVHEDTSTLSAPVGRIRDLIIDPGERVAAGLIRTENGRTFVLPFEHFRIFRNGTRPFVVVDRRVFRDAGKPYAEKNGVALLSRVERPDSVGYRPQEFLFSYYGSDPRTDIADLLADLGAKFGRKAFRTRPYEIGKGDTVCSIYAELTPLPLTRRTCPAAIERLFRVMNSDIKGLMSGVTVAIPVLDITQRKGDPSYTISYPVDAAMAAEFFGSFEMRNQRAFSVDYTGAGVGLMKQYQSAWDKVPTPAERLCSQGAAPGKEKSFFYLFDWLAESGWQPPDDIKACLLDCRFRNPDDDSACVDVVLADQVLQPHSDISGVIPMDAEGNIQAPIQSPATQSCAIDDPFDGTSQHGTHLASIIASKADDRGFVGIGPGLDLYAYPWTTRSATSDLGALFTARINVDAEKGPTFADMGPQVFVFASHFLSADQMTLPRSYGRRDITGDRLNAGSSRISYRAQFAIDGGSRYGVWVVSAMQKGRDIPEALEIDAGLAYSPVNLGDLPNVIVVTACDRCSEGDASVWKDSFFSRKFVHVAAPGMDVLAPVGNGHFAVAGGTSQATAIVGALVGAMINCYPKHYREASGEKGLRAGEVKARLQYTSRPIFYDPDDLGRLATGVVDPQAALLDPGKTWIRLRGESDYTELSGDQEPVHWCWNKIVLVDDNGDPPDRSPSTQNLLRMVRTTVPGGILGNDRPWVLYSLRPNEPGSIDRFEPRVFRMPEMEDQPIARKRNGEFLHPSEFDDLILASTLRARSCH